MSERIISLTTDFGLQDAFVGIMKGVILQINPKACIVDLCHNVPAGNILGASFLISCSYKYFPEQTIHVAVIDPGVGGERNPLLVQTPQYFFIAPDNGVLSYLYQTISDFRVIHLNQSQYFGSELSRTFHGRDIFAPVAAWLSTGLSPEVFGPEIQDYVKLEIPQPRCLKSNIFEFQIIYIDNFGNLITNVQESFFQQALSSAPKRSFSLHIGSLVINRLHTHYASLPEGQVGAIFGSTGNLEISVNQNRASQLLHMCIGDKGNIAFL